MTIAEALHAAAQYVEANPGSIAWDRGKLQSDADKTCITAEVLAIGRDLEALATASETTPVDYQQYVALKGDLQRRGFFLTDEIARDVASAFHAKATERP